MTSRGDINRAWEDRQGTSERAVLRARIAELEAEVATARHEYSVMNWNFANGRLAEDRLAAVIALCDLDGRARYDDFIAQIRAVATGNTT